MKRLLALLAALAALALFMPAALAEEGAMEYRAALSAWRDVARATEEIRIPAGAFSASDMPGLEVLPDGSVSTGSEGWLEYEVSVPETALYALRLRYFPGEGSGAAIGRGVYINGEMPFKEAGEITLPRAFNDKSRDYKLAEGNQPFPSQVETPEWMEVYARDRMGYIVEPLLFKLEKGPNRVRIASVNEGMLLDSLTFTSERTLAPYADYLAGHIQAGAEYAAPGAPIKVQAEDAALKSSPSFYPINDRTSPLTEPYHPSNIVLNAIGGTAWNEPGEWIAWDVEVPSAGLYRIAFRYKQSELRDLYAARSLLINGEIPFAEAADLRFYYSTAFQLACLSENRADPTRESGDREEFWFYLNEGVNRISLEVSLGALGDILIDLEQSVARLNADYREIVAITGSAPDQYRDYQIFHRVPGLESALASERETLAGILARLTALTGTGSERTSGIARLIVVIDEFLDDENEVVKRLSSFKECVTAIGKSTLDLKDQPLRLDYLMVLGEGEIPGRAEANFLEMSWHTLRAFVGSFTNSYNVSPSSVRGDAGEISVWLSTGRDQFDVIRRLINESFETETGVRVSLKLIGADVLLPSTFTGNGPDVAIQIGNSAPVNFAFRGAALDLTQFADYREIAAGFLPAALESFEYEGGVYALPDQMSFPVMYYRADIFESLALEPPETWAEMIALIPYLQRRNMEIYLDTAPQATLGAAISIGNSKAVNPIFLSMLYQLGGDIYLPDGSACDFFSESANTAFKRWTEFYTQHSFPREADFVTRFRIGEVPIGIVDLSTYSRLAVSAPEIMGSWKIAQVPGTRLAGGEIVRGAPCVTGAAMIVKNSAEARGVTEQAWEFLKWWTGAEAQEAYAREMEAVLGPAGRYPVANLAAFERISWPADVKAVLAETLPTLRGIPQVPGGYITGRYLENAFVTVVTDYENPGDILYEYTELINEEISKKRLEFGLEGG